MAKQYEDQVGFVAETQYGDFKGTVSAERDSHKAESGLRGLANALGATGGWPVAAKFYQEDDFVHVSLYMTAGDASGVSNYEGLQNHIAETGGSIEVHRVTTQKMSIEQFVNLFRRFSVALAPKGIGLENLNVVESTAIDDEE